MIAPVKLTPADWQEIFYALDSKLNTIPGPLPLAGKWTDAQMKTQKEKDDAETRRWADHLKRIMKKIGDDGKKAVRAFANSRSKSLEATVYALLDRLDGYARAEVADSAEDHMNAAVIRRARAVLGVSK